MDIRMRWPLVAVLLVAFALQGCGQVVHSTLPLERAAVAEPTTTSTSTTTTVPPPPPTTTPPPPSTAPKPRTVVTAAPRRAAPRAAPAAVTGGVAAYVGFGTWVDVFDWTNQWTNGHPTVAVADVDRMATL